jgi:hypothetical protein
MVRSADLAYLSLILPERRHVADRADRKTYKFLAQILAKRRYRKKGPHHPHHPLVGAGHQIRYAPIQDETRRAGGLRLNAAQLLPLLWDLYSRHPEMHTLEPWEMQSALFVLGYIDELESETEIAAAIAVARTDRTGRAA